MRDKEILGGSVSLFLHRARLRGGPVKPLSAHSMIFERIKIEARKTLVLIAEVFPGGPTPIRIQWSGYSRSHAQPPLPDMGIPLVPTKPKTLDQCSASPHRLAGEDPIPLVE